jgi:hypothetical protein
MINRKGISANENKSSSSSQSNVVSPLDIKVGRVKDIILNKDFPNIEVYGGLNSIGSILFESQQFNSNAYSLAKPLFPNLNNFPIVNELILIISLPNQNIGQNVTEHSYYYLSTINIWNHPHHNAYPNSFDLNPRISQQNNYNQIEAGVINTLNEQETNINYNSPSNVSQDTFVEKSNVHPLLPFMGDNILQGRYGNSLRLGSTNKTNNYFTNSWSTDGNNGDPISILRNGQPAESTDKGWEHIVENVNEDLSSIWLTSYQKIPLKIINENYNSYVSPPILTNQYNKPQIIINSDRIVINTKKDHLLLSSAKSLNLSAVESVNVNTKLLSIDAGSIKLGNKNANESVIKGDTLYRNLNVMLESLISLVDVLEVQQLWPGGLPSPDGVTSITAVSTKNTLLSVKSDLKNILSKTVKTI